MWTEYFREYMVFAHKGFFFMWGCMAAAGMLFLLAVFTTAFFKAIASARQKKDGASGDKES